MPKKTKSVATVKVKMLTNACGPGVNLRKNGIYNLPEIEAQAFINCGYAKAVLGKIRPAEKAVRESPEIPEK